MNKTSITQEPPLLQKHSVSGCTSFSVEQFPKNKDYRELSEEQKLIRKNAKKYYYGEEMTCNKCHKVQSINEFYIRNKLTGRRRLSCRDCQMKSIGVLDIGAVRFSKKILEKGFRRCSVCKDIKPITEYAKDKKRYAGYTNNCKSCNSLAVSRLQIEGKVNLTDWFVKEYGKRKYNFLEFDENLITKLRNEIIENRKPKYFIDEKEFVTIAEFARYIESIYGLPITMTEKRISEGKTEEQCKLTESEMRSISYTKGKVKVTDSITGEVFEFNNTSDPNLRKMFSTSAITRCILTGELTKVTSLSKYKNPCTISRVLV
jgi:hypothetical protein